MDIAMDGGFSGPEWEDVQPLYVDDGGKVVAIQYTQPHAEAISYFRALVAKNERSNRMLKLTAEMIRYNQADYTAWQIRWQCVEALNADLQQEFAFTRSIMLDNAKNYQLWNHRRKCALKAGESHAADELSFAREAIELDEKNYHAWAHRQAIVKAFGVWQAELQFVEELIQRDVRNNSAWNQRAWLLEHMPPDAPPAELLKRELEYTATQIQRAPRNESSWNYLKGLFALPPWSAQRLLLPRTPEVHTICKEALADCPSCPGALDILAEYYLGVMQLAHERLLAAGGAVAGSADLTVAKDAHDHIELLLEELFTADPMRSMYWQHRMHEAQLLRQAIDS